MLACLKKSYDKLSSIFKSKDITLLKKFSIIKAVFPVVMYGCDSWSIKNVNEELKVSNCGVGQESSLTPQFKSMNSSALSFLYGSILTSMHDYWKNHSFD